MSKEDNIIPLPPSHPTPYEAPPHEEHEVEVSHSVTATNKSNTSFTPSFISPSTKQYAIELAQLFLCGTSSWAVSRTSYDVDRIAWGTYTFLLGHGLISLLKVTFNNENKEKIGAYYNYIDFVTKFLPLPLINAQIYYNYDYHGIITFTHAFSSLLPFAFNACTKNWNCVEQTDSKTTVVKVVSFSNICSLAYIGITYENYWAIGLSVLSLINEVALDFMEGNNSSIALAFFNICAVNAIESI